MSPYIRDKYLRICLVVISANPVKRLRHTLIYIGSNITINYLLSVFSRSVYCYQTYVSTLRLTVIDLICPAVTMSAIIGVTPGLMGGMNATADTVIYWVVGTVNVTHTAYHPLS